MSDSSLVQPAIKPAPTRPENNTPLAEAARNRTVQKLFTRDYANLVRVITARLGSVSEAHDVAQEAYLKLLEIDQPRTGVTSPRAYLFRIAINLATDRLRKRQVRERGTAQAYTMQNLLAPPQPDRILTGSEQLTLVKRAMWELPEKCRCACALHFFAELSVREVAEHMDLSRRMVRYYLARGLSHCRYALDTEPDPELKATDQEG